MCFQIYKLPSNVTLFFYFVCQVGRDIAAALAYLHNTKHLLHGDIKSANVLIRGDFEIAKLCDFGVTVKLNDQLEAIDPEEFVGTDVFLSPSAIL